MGLASRHRDFPGIAVEIKAYGSVSPFPRAEILVNNHAETVVEAVEMPGVVNEMVAVTVINPEGAVGFVVAVRDCQRTLSLITF